jgi:hypothetical protein
MVEMSRDMFHVYLTFALVLGVHLPTVYEYIAMRWS